MMRIGGLSDARAAQVRRAARRGDVRQLRRGAYVGMGHWSGLDADRRHVLEIHAAVEAVRTPVVVSHASAAVLWNLPVVGARERRVHLTSDGASGPAPRASFVRHATERDVPTVVVGGLPVTSVARTVVDLARTNGFLTGVVAGDAALRLGLVTVDDLTAEVASLDRRRGIRVARDVVAFVDGRSESPGESLSRVRMHEAGLPLPTLQHEVFDRDGFVGRVDFWWEAVRVIGEFDGRTKYGIDPETRSAADQLWDEKRREDRLRATRASMVRWTWADAWTVTPMVTALRRAGVSVTALPRAQH